MKVRRYQADEEKTILTALIVNDRVCGQVAQDLGDDREPFKNKWSNLVAGWCVEYFKKHRKAPRKVVQHLYTQWAAAQQDEEAAGFVESFLESLSGEYEALGRELNEKWILDKAGEHFNKVRMERMAVSVQNALENHDYGRAVEAAQYKPVSFSKEAWVNPFGRLTIERTLQRLEKTQPVIQFPGDLGRFLSEHFEREGFISFAGPEKRGKSYWLDECTWLALNQRRRVIKYTLGDLSAEQAFIRMYARMTMKPKKLPRENEGKLRIPKEIKITGKDETGHPIADVLASQELRTPYTQADVEKAVDQLKMNSAMRELPIRLRCSGAGVVSASDIEADILQLSREGWMPDVVVIDYADLLASEAGTGRLDFRHQIDATWKILRRISLDYHILVLTATQAAARAYEQWLIRKKDFSEDKRKNAHVTGMIGINQTPGEKKKGIYRLNWIFLRDGEWTENQYVWTAGNLALGCPAMRSLLR